MSETFSQLGFDDGRAFAYASATFGIVAASCFGPLLAAWLSRRHPIEGRAEDTGADQARMDPSEGFSPLTGKLTLHLALVAIVILVGKLLLDGLIRIEGVLRGDGANRLLTEYVPLFAVVLIAGLLVQLFLQATGWSRFFERRTLEKVSTFGLDMVIAGALATLDLSVIGEHWLPISALCFAGLAWNLAVFFGLGPRIYRQPWHSYGLGDLGGGTATTATGLLLIRTADPQRRTDARRAYSEKQPFYEPLMGGGFVTALALPSISSWGAEVTLALTVAILAVWIAAALWLGRGYSKEKAS